MFKDFGRSYGLDWFAESGRRVKSQTRRRAVDAKSDADASLFRCSKTRKMMAKFFCKHFVYYHKVKVKVKEKIKNIRLVELINVSASWKWQNVGERIEQKDLVESEKSLIKNYLWYRSQLTASRHIVPIKLVSKQMTNCQRPPQRIICNWTSRPGRPRFIVVIIMTWHN